jgi:hypothetical protein
MLKLVLDSVFCRESKETPGTYQKRSASFMQHDSILDAFDYTAFRGVQKSVILLHRTS